MLLNSEGILSCLNALETQGLFHSSVLAPEGRFFCLLEQIRRVKSLLSALG